MALHVDEFEIGLPLVRALVDRARPDLASHPLRRLEASGSSNALFRLGEDLLVRLPRQPGGSRTIAKEARWLPYVSVALPVPVPRVVAVGEPGLGYPERWSIVTWLDGTTPDVPAASGGANDGLADGLARDLARVVGALRALAVPADALADPDLRSYRGRPLAALDSTTRKNLADCREVPGLDLDVNACLRVWEAALALPNASPSAPCWLHGDLLAENLLVRDCRLAAVLDFGVLSVGDPTVDLVVAWELLNVTGRQTFRTTLAVDAATWERGRAWALAIAAMTFPYYWPTMPDRCATRLSMARAVLADARADGTL